jgi:hypothetical protein
MISNHIHRLLLTCRTQTLRLLVCLGLDDGGQNISGARDS